MTVTPDGETLLAVDFGSTTTRAILLDVAYGGAYRFVAAGRAPTTIEHPFANVSEGLRHALDDLGAITGRAFLDESDQLIMPGRGDGSGVDRVVAVTSAGPPLRTVILGLLPDTSVESGRRLAASTYLNVVEVIGLGDRRRQEQQVDAIVRAKPGLVIIAGGTDGGSSEAVMRLAETVGLACQLMETERRPRVLFAGNASLRSDITRLFGSRHTVNIAQNVRPTLDTEDIITVRHELAALYASQRIAAFPGYGEAAQWSKTGILPTATAFGRIVQFLSKCSDSSKITLGVDLGSANTTLAAASNGNLWLNVHAQLGVGHSAQTVLEHTTLDKITRWLPIQISERAAREYVINRTLHPNTIPHQLDELYLEHALAREALRAALRLTRPGWPVSWPGGEKGLMPRFESILACGAVFSGAPRPGHAALMLLDALEPTGVTSLILDMNSLAPAIGAAASIDPLITAQVLDSGSFLNLGCVVAPVGRLSAERQRGQVAVRVKMAYANGEAAEAEVAYGSLQFLPLPVGQSATITLQPARGLDLGHGPGRPAMLRDVRGGAVGLIVDARGRPLSLPPDAGERRDAIQKWIWDLEG